MRCHYQQIMLFAIVLTTAFSPVLLDGAISFEPQIAARSSLVETLSCAEPVGTAVEICRQIEERILQSTVRIEITSWAVLKGDRGFDFDVKASHATLKDGRYLVTHNHFSSAFNAQDNIGQLEGYQSVRLSDAQGKMLFQGPLSDFEVVWEDEETLVIGHRNETIFGRLGLVSAEFVDGTAVSLQPGMEVAQIDWDGSNTWVEWTTIEAVQDENGVPVLVLDGDIMIGASGGGVFWQGAHVANNWTVRQALDGADVVVDSTTKVALNSKVVVE